MQELVGFLLQDLADAVGGDRADGGAGADGGPWSRPTGCRWCPVFYREVCVYTQAHKALSPAAASLAACLDEVVSELQFAEPIGRG